MNTEKVFTGFNKSEEEILLYRENSDEYIDLINKEKIKKEYIDIETLKKLSETLKVLKYMPENLIIKLYNYDRSKLINTKDILVGLKAKIIDINETKTESGWYYNNIPLYSYHYEWDLLDKEMGLYSYKKELIIDKEYKFKIYENIYDGKCYVGFTTDVKNICQFPEFNNGMKYVRFSDYTLRDLVNEPVIEKKKLYEYANATRKEKLESGK